MAWSDEPTDGQLNAIANLLRWQVSQETIKEATNWLYETATRQEVSYELQRLRGLYLEHKLTEDNCFSSDIWEGFSYV